MQHHGVQPEVQVVRREARAELLRRAREDGLAGRVHVGHQRGELAVASPPGGGEARGDQQQVYVAICIGCPPGVGAQERERDEVVPQV